MKLVCNCGKVLHDKLVNYENDVINNFTCDVCHLDFELEIG